MPLAKSHSSSFAAQALGRRAELSSSRIRERAHRSNTARASRASGRWPCRTPNGCSRGHRPRRGRRSRTCVARPDGGLLRVALPWAHSSGQMPRERARVRLGRSRFSIARLLANSKNLARVALGVGSPAWARARISRDGCSRFSTHLRSRQTRLPFKARRLQLLCNGPLSLGSSRPSRRICSLDPASLVNPFRAASRHRLTHAISPRSPPKP